jgi:hypothetical protein
MKFFMFMFSSLLRIKHEITSLVAREGCGGLTLDLSWGFIASDRSRVSAEVALNNEAKSARA